MDNYLSTGDKYDFQQNYRRYENSFVEGVAARDSLKEAKASRIWVIGVLVMFFSMTSDFFLGAAAAILGLYFYNVIRAQVKKSKLDESKEEVERWFNQKNVVFHDKTPFFKSDEQLQNPLDLYKDESYR